MELRFICKGVVWDVGIESSCMSFQDSQATFPACDSVGFIHDCDPAGLVLVDDIVGFYHNSVIDATEKDEWFYATVC